MYKGFYTILDPQGKDIGLRLYDKQDASGVIRFYRNTDQSYTVRQAFGFKSIAPGRAPLASALGDEDGLIKAQFDLDFIYKELPKKSWYWTMNGAGVRTSIPTQKIDEVIDTYMHHAERNIGEVIIAVVDWKLMPELGRFGSDEKLGSKEG